MNNNFVIFNRFHKIPLVSQDPKRLLVIILLAESLESPKESKCYLFRLDGFADEFVGGSSFSSNYTNELACYSPLS